MNLVLLGTSRLLYLVAEAIQAFYAGQHEITILDTELSAINQKYEKVFSVRTGSRQDLFERIRNMQGETFLLSVNNRYLISDDIIQMPQMTLINLHHALLPAHPGRNAEAWTIFEGDRFGGVTWHYIDSGVDTGQILVQASCEVTDEMRSIDLLKSCERLALSSLQRLLPFEKIRHMPTESQCFVTERIVHRASDIPAGGYLDAEWEMRQISCFLRALDYGARYPLGRPMLQIEGRIFEIRRYKIDHTALYAKKKTLWYDLTKKTVEIRKDHCRIGLRLGKEI